MMNGLYLELERATILDVATTSESQRIAETKELRRGDQVCSAAELRNAILITEAVYT